MRWVLYSWFHMHEFLSLHNCYFFNEYSYFYCMNIFFNEYSYIMFNDDHPRDLRLKKYKDFPFW